MAYKKAIIIINSLFSLHYAIYIIAGIYIFLQYNK